MTCAKCKGDNVRLQWQKWVTGDGWHIRATCRKCGHVEFAKQTPENEMAADQQPEYGVQEASLFQ